jgi:hypothetical protein
MTLQPRKEINMNIFTTVRTSNLKYSVCLTTLLIHCRTFLYFYSTYEFYRLNTEFIYCTKQTRSLINVQWKKQRKNELKKRKEKRNKGRKRQKYILLQPYPRNSLTMYSLKCLIYTYNMTQFLTASRNAQKCIWIQNVLAHLLTLQHTSWKILV